MIHNITKKIQKQKQKKKNKKTIVEVYYDHDVFGTETRVICLSPILWWNLVQKFPCIEGQIVGNIALKLETVVTTLQK